jgi:hypothetical protein
MPTLGLHRLTSGFPSSSSELCRASEDSSLGTIGHEWGLVLGPIGLKWGTCLGLIGHELEEDWLLPMPCSTPSTVNVACVVFMAKIVYWPYVDST